MSLTPEDVLNKTFGTTQFRRGYDEREVDDFLDEVVATLRILDKELTDCRSQQSAPVQDSAAAVPLLDSGMQSRLDREVGLRQEAERALAELQSRVHRQEEERLSAAAQAGDADAAQLAQATRDSGARAQEAEQAARARIEAANARADEAERAAQERISRLNAEADRIEADVRDRIDAANGRALDAESAGVEPARPTDASGLIALAQRVHDEHVAEGETTRARLISEGQSRHDSLLSTAQARHDELLTAAQSQHDELVSTAQARHDELVTAAQSQHDNLLAEATSSREEMLGEARERVAGMIAEASGRRAEILSDLEDKRADLETAIADLRSYEQTYRSRLRAFIEDALTALDTTEPVSETMPAVPVPAS